MYSEEEKEKFEKAIDEFIKNIPIDIIKINISCKKSMKSIQFNCIGEIKEKNKIL